MIGLRPSSRAFSPILALATKESQNYRLCPTIKTLQQFTRFQRQATTASHTLPRDGWALWRSPSVTSCLFLLLKQLPPIKTAPGGRHIRLITLTTSLQISSISLFTHISEKPAPVCSDWALPYQMPVRGIIISFPCSLSSFNEHVYCAPYSAHLFSSARLLQLQPAQRSIKNIINHASWGTIIL